VVVRPIVASAIAALVASVAVAADDAALLAEAQQVFQPLPKEMSTADAPVEGGEALQGVDQRRVYSRSADCGR
jgi:hypothetical protein